MLPRVTECLNAALTAVEAQQCRYDLAPVPQARLSISTKRRFVRAENGLAQP